MIEASLWNDQLESSWKQNWDYAPTYREKIDKGIKPIKSMIHYSKISMAWADAEPDRKQFWGSETQLYDANLICIRKNGINSQPF